MRKGFLLRERDWAYIQYGEKAESGIELFDMRNDPQQFTNLAEKETHANIVAEFKRKIADKLTDVRNNDLK